jgi:hypothetical protein
MMARSVLVFAVTLAALQWPASAGAPPLPNTYVLSQAFCVPPQATAPGKCQAQSLPAGATLEIQLPGTPSVWKMTSVPRPLKNGRRNKIASPGRIDGTSEIYVFTLTAGAVGKGDLVFEETPAHIAKPGGTFTFPIVVTAAK